MNPNTHDSGVDEVIERAFDKFGTDEDTRNHPEGREGVFASNNNFSRDEWVAGIAFKAGFKAALEYLRHKEEWRDEQRFQQYMTDMQTDFANRKDK